MANENTKTETKQAPWQVAVDKYLAQRASTDSVFAERLNNPAKSRERCYKYITAEAKAQAVNGCACIEDAVVYGWANHYYDEDNLEIDKPKVAPKASTTATASKDAKKGAQKTDKKKVGTNPLLDSLSKGKAKKTQKNTTSASTSKTKDDAPKKLTKKEYRRGDDCYSLF